jgi:CheY-like chemotaxis protein
MAKLQVKKATKKTKKLRCLITGQAGAGKTFSALLLAKGLVPDGRILVFDTENGRAGLKVGSKRLGGLEWDVIEVTPDSVTSDIYIEAIEIAEKGGYDIIILDSMTHEWDFIKITQLKLGGRYTDWGQAKAYHHRLIRKILSCKVHVICTARSDMKHEQQEVNGKKQVIKLGLGTQQESSMPYEMDFVFDITNRNHDAVVDKQEDDLFISTPTIIICEETGQRLAAFLADGEDEDTTKKKLFISRIAELQENLVSQDKLTDDQKQEIADLDLTAMSVEALTALGLQYKNLLGV